jgi:hypothetical protein
MGCGVTNFRLEGTYTTTPNSECLNAGLLYCGASGNGTTIGSTVKDELAPYGGLSPNGSYGVWYKYSNIGNQSDVTFSLCDTTQVFDSKVIVYKGSCADLFPIASNDDACGINSKVTFRNDGVSTYYILVFGEEVSTSDFSYTLTCNDVVPANDDIENAIDVNPFTQPYTDIAVPLINATMEADSADFIKTGCDMGAGWYPNVFYKFMAEKNGTATASFSTPNGGGFNIIGFYTAPDKNAAIADLSFASGQQCNQYSSSKSISITEGTVYYVVMMSPYTNSDILINLEYDSMAVSEVHNLKLNIYPNPVKDLLNIESNDELSKVEIFDLSGKQIFLQKTGSKNLQLNISSLNAGTYILKASSAMKVLTSKIIKK